MHPVGECGGRLLYQGLLREGELSGDVLKKALEMGVSLHRDPIREPGEGHLLGILRGSWRGPEMEHLSLSLYGSSVRGT
jgi:hypothetical protein